MMLTRKLRLFGEALRATLAETYLFGNILLMTGLTALFLLPHATLMLQLMLPSLMGVAREATAAILYIENIGAAGEGAGPPAQGPPQDPGAAGGGGAGPGGPAAPLVDLTGGDDKEPANCQTFAQDNLECFQVPPTGEV